MSHTNTRSRSGLLSILLLVIAAAFPATGVRADSLTITHARGITATPPSEYVPGEVLVKFRPGVASAKTEPLNGALGLARIDRIEHLDIERYQLAVGADVFTAVRRLRERPDVLFAEPNYISYPAVVPNDTYYAGVDGYSRDLQEWTFGGITGDTGINAEEAWDITTGRPEVTIAFVDSGVFLTQGDLAPNLWTNPGEIPGNGVDDDGNGFVDDIHGWDFYSSDADANPDLGNGINDDGVGSGDDNTFHGTFAANLACGRGNDGRGVLGSAWNCTVMSCKVFTDDGGANNFHIAAAMRYAADNGASVINASLETRTSSSTIQEGVAYAVSRDVVVVAAAGNGNTSSPVYPAAYDGVLSVGATNHAFESPSLVQAFGPANFLGRPFFSNYGVAAVDVVAPGIVFSSSVASQADALADPELHAGDVVGFTAAGTSFSSPIVAGLAGLIVSRDMDLNGGIRTLTNSEVIDIIERTARDLPDDPTDIPDGGPMWDNHGLVNFVAALNEVSGGSGGRAVRLEWQAPSTDVTNGPPRNLTATESSPGKREPEPGAVAPGPIVWRAHDLDRALPGPALVHDTTALGQYDADKVQTSIAEVEPNNSIATAQPIPIPATVNGQISTTDEGTFDIVYGDGTHDVVEDMYKLSLAAETSISLTLTPAGDSDLDLGLLTDLDGDGTYTVEQQYLSANPASGPGQSEGLPNLQLPAGTYYVLCSIYDGAPRVNSDTYTLTVATGAPVVTGYRVYRSVTPGVPTSAGNRIAQLSGAQLSFVDSSAPEGDVYYVVTALYGDVESGASNETSPGSSNPNAPAIVNPVYRKGKLLMDAVDSRIITGTVVVVDNAETFTLGPSKDATKWLVKKKARSNPGNRTVAQAIPAGRTVSLYLVTPTGLRSPVISFSR